MNTFSSQKRLLRALVISTLALVPTLSVQAAFGTGTENRMAVLHAAANYNPHEKDAVIPSDASIVSVRAEKSADPCKMASTNIWVCPMQKHGNAL